MAERRRFSLFNRRNNQKTVTSQVVSSQRIPTNKSFSVAAGIPDIVRDTERLRSDNKFDNEYDLYDSMLKLDPELKLYLTI